jgi:tetratricopeptide (TPR) repeat protein
MKRTISLWLGLLAFALLPVLAQTPAAPAIKGPTGSIHGAITGPEGAPKTSGSVSLSTDDGHTNKFTFQVSTSGTYEGIATPGTYKVVYRTADSPPDRFVDSFDKVKIVAGQDVLQDFDMSRKEFVDKLPAEQQKQLVELRKHNAEAMKDQDVVKHIQADLRICDQDFKDVDHAHATAIQALGTTAPKPEVEAKEVEIRLAKFTEIETLMLKDTGIKPGESVLWARLGQGEIGLKKFDEAEAAFKKALDAEAASKKPMPQNQGVADSGLGEVYARTGKIAEAAAAYDAAAKVNPAQAGFYYKNEAIIYYQLRQTGSPLPNLGSAQAAAADKAVKANEANKVDPASQTILFALIGQGLLENATYDAKTKLYVLPPGCAEAYQMYLKLDPTGQFSADAKGILTQAGIKIDSKAR